jgi:hypothetical protein
MILADIKTYLMKRGRAPLSDIALHLGSDPDAVRGMLDRWMRKGKVRKLLANTSCGNRCNACDPAANEIYEWSDGGKQPGAEFIIRSDTCRN